MSSVMFLSMMNSAAWGGSEEIWLRSAICIAKKKITVGICCFDWTGKEKKLQELRDAGCEIYLLPGRKETKTIFSKYKLRKMLNGVPFFNYEKIIVNQGGWKDVAHGPFKKLNEKLPPYFLLFHNYDETDNLSAGKKKLFQSWVTKAEKNIGDAARIFTGIKKSTGIHVPKQEVLFNPITFPQPDKETPFSSSPSGKLIFTMLAELDVKRKAQDILIQTLATDKWKNRNFELNLYGKGKDQSFLEELIKEKQLSSKVFLKGFTNNVQRVLADSHLILQVTHFDAMPIAVTEAMAVSRPVIVSNVGDMPIWIQDDVNGWIAPQATPGEIDIVLEKAWQNRNKLEQMGIKSFNIFKEKYPADPVEFFLKQTGIL